MNDAIQLINDYGLKFGIIIVFFLIFIFLIKYIVEIVLNNIVSTKYTNKVAKYENSLQRKTMAYKVILEKELEFYEMYYKSASKLVTNIQDIETNCIEYISGNDESFEKVRKYMLSVLKTIPEIKSKILIYESYIDIEIMERVTSLIVKLQEEFLPFVEKIMKEDKKEEYKKQMKEVCDGTLLILSLVSVKIRERYDKLINE